MWTVLNNPSRFEFDAKVFQADRMLFSFGGLQLALQTILCKFNIGCGVCRPLFIVLALVIRK